MMKYRIIEISFMDKKFKHCVIDRSDGSFESFSASVKNPRYVQFLVDAQLTDTEVNALTPDTWYDFPEGE